MKKSIRFIGIFVCLALALSAILPAQAANSSAIDVSNASDGYYTVNYSGTAKRMKVGVTFNGTTRYENYTPGVAAVYAFTEGNGTYKLNLYANISGTSYKRVASAEVKVSLKNSNAQYLVSTTEISFAKGGDVEKKAADLCKDSKSDSQKIVAIYNFMRGFSYDYDLADKISRGKITVYTPDTASVLNAKKGICYDLSALFAAMCRSQGIACKLVKGTYNKGAHAWNEVLCDGEWYRIDTTYAAQYNVSAKTVAECVTPLTAYAA